jgi:DeoR/GlpR family transcriptional regulator of sugar metabolism
MLKAERHRKILRLLDDRVSVEAAFFAAKLGVTPMTIWRDLKHLEEHKLVVRTRGGAMKREVSVEPTYQAKKTAQRLAKERIAEAAVRRWVRPKMLLALDGGTTTGVLASRLPDLQLTILTNCIPIVAELRHGNTNNTVYCSGGLLRNESGTLVGRDAVTFFSRRRTELLFLSATGLSAEAGLTDPNPMEIEVKQAMAFSSRLVVLLHDSTKFGDVSLMEVLPLEKVRYLVTDKRPCAALAKYLVKKGVETVVA